MRMDDEGELAPVVQDDEKVLRRKDIPENWLFEEPGYFHSEMKWSTLLHERYDGADAPSTSFKHPSKNHRLDTRNWCIVHIKDFGGDGYTIGTLKKEEGKLEPFVKVSWTVCTQRPALKLHINTTRHGEVTCTIFANSISRKKENECKLRLAGAGGQLTLPDYPALKAEDYRDLVEIDLQLFEWNANLPEGTDGARPTRPIFEGVDDDSIQQYVDAMDGIGDDADAQLSAMGPGEYLLGLLYGTNDISIYRTWPQEGYEVFKSFRQWITTSFDMCARNGNEWFYHLQQSPDEPSIYSTDCALRELQMPRWMAKSFKAPVNEKGALLGAPVPVKCNHFPFSEGDQVFPTVEDAAFELRLAIERDRAFQSHILNSSFRQRNFQIRGEFLAHPRIPGCYVVELRTSDNNLLASDKTLRPQIDTRISLEAAEPIVDELGEISMLPDPITQTKRFEGVICDDLWNSGAEVVCVVTGPVVDLQHTTGRMLNATLRDDPTPANRHLATIEEIAAGFKRQSAPSPRSGVDIPAIVLRAPPAVKNTGSLKDAVTPELEDVYSTAIHPYGLNDKQKDAAYSACSSKSGLVLIQGPPGCGKTRCAMACAEGEIRIGEELKKINNNDGCKRQVVACAPSNIATDAMLDKFLASYDRSRPLEIVRYKGSFLHEKRARAAPPPPPPAAPAPSKPAAADPEMLPDAGDEDDDDLMGLEELNETVAEREEQEMQAALWELAEEVSPTREDAHQEYAFHTKRLAAIKSWAATKSHSQNYHAKDYLQVREKLRNGAQLDKKRKRRLKEHLDYVEWQLSEYYLQHVVDIVFCTNSAAAHGMLRLLYRPKMLISDEAAVTTLPDAATPMGAFMLSLQLIVMAGDMQQQQPVVASKGSNEFYAVLSSSLFSMIYNSKKMASSVISLEVQHRMHPDLAEPVSRIFYRGSLKNHQSVIDRVSPKWETLSTVLAPLQPAYNGRRRLCIDVSGQAIASEAYNNTTSHFNAAEAQIIADFIGKACRAMPPINGAQIEPSDFLVLTPYTGQAQVVRNILVKRGISRAGNKVRVASTRAIQGEEARFVIISFTRNVKDKPLQLGLASEGHGLCVATSRPQEFLMMLGNWRAWAQAHHEGAGVLTNTGASTRTRHFGQLIADCRAKSDIVSAGDYLKFSTGVTIKKAEFPSLITDPPTGMDRRGGRGGSRGGFAGRDRGDAIDVDYTAGGGPAMNRYDIYDQQQQQQQRGTNRGRYRGGRPRGNAPRGAARSG
ncbi:P-loop containing nucleoside triphosphate hydrolase protein, partial [Neohortaea acidophila]